MSAWIAAVGTLIALAAFVAQFYFKWVPKVEDQKRHLKQVAWAAFDAVTLCSEAFAIYLLTQAKGPVTHIFVVNTAVVVSGAGFCIILIATRRGVGSNIMMRSLDNFGRLIDTADRHLGIIRSLQQITERHLATTEQHTEILNLISNDPGLSVETVQAVRKILSTPPDKFGDPDGGG